jgi:rod shape determining protein RodA
MSLRIPTIFKNVKNIDWLLMVAIFLLICFGLTSLYSLTLGQADKNFNFLSKQIIFSVIGLALIFIIATFDYRWWQSLSGWFYAAAVVLLILVLFLGQNLKGATGWFVWNIFSFQPVEFAKLAVIIFLARCFSQWSLERYQLKLWLKSFLVILPVCILLLLQPDFGSMAVIFGIWFGMLWLAGINKKHILIFLLILVLISALGWQFILHDYQKNRLLTFLNPQLDPLGIGYNTRQSMVAIGAGGFLGRGLSLGTQSQLHFLPISEADFIFAALAEELGFVGVLFIFILYLILFYALFKIMRKAKDNFSLLTVFGFNLMFFIHLVINVGMTIGFLPVTGLPLPFVSYGGSFLLISLIGIGIIQSIKLRQNISA